MFVKSAADAKKNMINTKTDAGYSIKAHHYHSSVDVLTHNNTQAMRTLKAMVEWGDERCVHGLCTVGPIWFLSWFVSVVVNQYG